MKKIAPEIFLKSDCPYCGASFEVDVDVSAGNRQAYIEECPTCCQPCQVEVAFTQDLGWQLSLKTTQE